MDDAIVGPGYLDTLDTIPEDVSVAATALQHPTPRIITNLSTASAVASSDSECDDDDDTGGGGIEVAAEDHSRNVLSGNWRKKKKKDNDKMTGKESKRRAKRPRQGSGTPISTTGALIFGGGGDAFSDTHASLGGVGDSLDRQSKPSEEAPKPGAVTSIFCRKRAFLFYSVIVMLLVAIGVGIYFIVTKVSHHSSNSDTSVDAKGNSVFPPYQLEGESFFPSAAPSYNQAFIADLDAVLRSIPGVDANKLNDKSTPEGQCRHWMAHSDSLELRADVVGEKRIEQRYILCLLYYYTDGENWIIETWLNGDLHECDWYGIRCSANDVVAVELDKKNLTGSIPASIESLSTLRFLSLQDNAISGNIPESIFDILPDLKWLDLSNNALTGNIPSLEDDSVSSSTLEVLYIKGNQLEGILPFFPNLQRLRAQRNLLTSMDERYASSAESLVYLYAYDNKLAGSLPSKWNTPNLKVLDLGFNNLVGTIPQDLWDLPSLLSLIVDNNQLTGNLPESSSSSTLNKVWLNNNLLNGTIPFTFGDNWSNLTRLRLQENDLTGTVSKDHCSVWPLSGSVSESSGWEFQADCNLDSMQCECCTKCYPTARLRYLRAEVAPTVRNDDAHATNVNDDEPSWERLDGFLVTEHDAHR